MKQQLDGSHDFDFLLGRWRVQNERLLERLKGSDDWEQFEATLEVRPILGGLGNTDEFITDYRGSRFIGMSLRLYNPQTQLWSIYWVDNRSAVLQPLVVGSFEKGIGRFEGRDEHEGRPVISRFIWSEITDKSARWEQALSPDDGKIWETNWIMLFQRI